MTQITTSSKKRQLIKSFAALIVIGGVALLFPLLFRISPCIIYNVFGLPCPACGMTRAFVSLFRLEIGRAFFYHPLFFIVPGIPVLMILPEKPRNIISFVFAGALIGLWIARMIIFFPHIEPMLYNESSLLAFLRRLR